MPVSSKLRTAWRAWIPGLATALAALAALPPADPVSFTSITVEGTNLVVVATIPPDMATVSLEMRPSLTASWEQRALTGVNAAGGAVALRVARPESSQAFFRLLVKPRAEGGHLVSKEVNYVAIAPIATGDAKAITLHIRGVVDGSDRLLITRSGILWDHVNWDWPQSLISVNGVQWDPLERSYITIRGSSLFLPKPYAPGSVVLEKIKGRGVVAVERMDGALLAYVNDTELGADEYEFKLHFRPAAEEPAGAPASKRARLNLVARIDGCDTVRISATGATWLHQTHQAPTGVSVNNIPWTAPTNAPLKNEGRTAFLPAGVDFSTASIVRRKGRDLATLWAEKDSILVHFADNPNGADLYELDIAFGN